MNSDNYLGLIEVNFITPSHQNLSLTQKTLQKVFKTAKPQRSTPSFRSFERIRANPLHKKPHIFQNTKS